MAGHEKARVALDALEVVVAQGVGVDDVHLHTIDVQLAGLVPAADAGAHDPFDGQRLGSLDELVDVSGDAMHLGKTAGNGETTDQQACAPSSAWLSWSSARTMAAVGESVLVASRIVSTG